MTTQPDRGRNGPIAIHDAPGTFSDAWIRYCEERGVPYRRVNCYSTDIIAELADCPALMWHWSHTDASAAAFARQLTMSLERMGKRVFPDTPTAWHFDDKLGQKYLLESLGIPHVPTFAFYDEPHAREFVSSHGLPLVFKLARGAGSANVRLLSSRAEAARVIARSFGRGWANRSRLQALRERTWQFRRDRTASAFMAIGRGVYRAFLPSRAFRTRRIESGYVYFQEFVAGNDSDVRIIVTGGRAFGIRRYVRDGDFRASGSGRIGFQRSQIPLECVRIAFEAAEKMEAQVAAFDFVFRDGEPLVVEVSYGFHAPVYRECEGYWGKDLEWHSGTVDPEAMMIEAFIDELIGDAG